MEAFIIMLAKYVNTAKDALSVQVSDIAIVAQAAQKWEAYFITFGRGYNNG